MVIYMSILMVTLLFNVREGRLLVALMYAISVSQSTCVENSYYLFKILEDQILGD
jgi:hypothetical protein